MSAVHGERNAPPEPAATPPLQAVVSPADRVPRTRTGVAWFVICTAAVAFVVLLVFMLQNTRRVEVTFLWLHGSAPLAMALLVAAVGAAILTMAVGTARILQLRRRSRQRR